MIAIYIAYALAGLIVFYLLFNVYAAVYFIKTKLCWTEYSELGPKARPSEQRRNVVDPARKAAMTALEAYVFERRSITSFDGFTLTARLYRADSNAAVKRGLSEAEHSSGKYVSGFSAYSSDGTQFGADAANSNAGGADSQSDSSDGENGSSDGARAKSEGGKASCGFDSAACLFGGARAGGEYGDGKGNSSSGVKPRKLILCAHGFSSHGPREFAAIIPFFLSQGADVLMIAERAHFESGGKYCGMGILERYDIKAWAEYAAAGFENTDILIYGVSMGAAAAAMACSLGYPKSVRGLVFDAGYTVPYVVYDRAIRDMLYPLALPGLLLPIMSFLNKRFFGKWGLKDADSSDGIKDADFPCLFICGDRDEYIRPEVFDKIYDACPAKKERFIVENAEHVSAYYLDPPAYEKKIYDFFRGSFFD
ncbi:MAG: alpha/beta hydrolase [Clostridiales bacterium]|jgi:pimeloyl-ACP methyl ester carboxylesterase|nr:alpha/beta hydrolase [Clostridiales bacterium]